MPEIGTRIKNRREELEMTQGELASKLGYKSKTTIAKIENGTNDIVQSKVRDFAKALNTTTSYLMGWEETPEWQKGIEFASLMKKYDKLTDANKKAVLNLIDNLLSGQ